MHAKATLGIDLGTSSVKAAVIERGGRILGQAAVEYTIQSPQPGWAEQDPQVWYTAAMRAASEAVRASGLRPAEIGAVGLSGQMHGLVCVDEHKDALRPAIIWADQRSASQVERVNTIIGRERLARYTANPLGTGFMLASWLWLVENEPETARKTVHMLLPKDYLRMRLTGRIGAEPSDASSTLLFDTAQRVWSRPLLDGLGIDPSLLPPLSEGWQVAGGLLEECAAAIGLPAGTPVVFGAADAAAQALGLGVIEPGVLACLISSGGQLITPLAAPIYDAGLRMHTFCHAAPQRWYLEAATLSAGLSLRWLRDRIFPGSSYQELADWAEGSGSPAGLFFLPHLTGERTPYMDPQSRACFYGLGSEHDGGSLVRAVMEGVVYSLRQCLDLMESVAGRVERVVASGGGARHPFWLRLMADIFDRPIYRSESLEGAALGAALLAGVGCGLYADVPSACAESVHWSRDAVQPDPTAVERYAAAYPVFLRLYPAARSVRKVEGKEEQYPFRKGE